jgi:hypothetical protein
VLKRVVASGPGRYDATDLLTYCSPWDAPAADTVPAQVPTDAESAAREALARSVAGGNPLSQNALQTQFRLSRAEATKVRQAVLGGSNGHGEATAGDG